MDKRNLFKMSCYGGFYSMCVLALLEPFGIDQIQDYRLLFIFCEGMLAVLVAWLSVLIYNCFRPISNDLANQSRLRIAIDNLAIHLINIPLLSGALLTFCGWMNRDDLGAYWVDGEGHFTWLNFGYMALSVAIISVFVYAFTLYLTWNRRLKLQLDDALAINDLLAARLDRQSEQEEATPEPVPSVHADPKIVLESATEGTSLRVSPSDIVYAESMSNYADICYMHDGQLCHHQLRTTMRQLRDQLADYDMLVSCHRAYIVNLNFVSSISMRSGSDYYQLQLFGQEKQIPVSRANTGEIKERLKNNLGSQE